jgi:hypothetical protein
MLLLGKLAPKFIKIGIRTPHRKDVTHRLQIGGDIKKM